MKVCATPFGDGNMPAPFNSRCHSGAAHRRETQPGGQSQFSVELRRQPGRERFPCFGVEGYLPVGITFACTDDDFPFSHRKRHIVDVQTCAFTNPPRGIKQ